MKVNKNYVLSHFNDVNVLVDVTGKFNGVVRLSATSADVWQAFADGKSIEEAAKLLSEKYDVSYEKALADTTAFCDKLLENGLIEK